MTKCKQCKRTIYTNGFTNRWGDRFCSHACERRYEIDVLGLEDDTEPEESSVEDR